MNLFTKFLFAICLLSSLNCLSAEENLFSLGHAQGFIQVDDIKKNGYRQLVYKKDDSALSVIYKFSQKYDFKSILMAEIQNLQRIQNNEKGDIKYFPTRKLKSMGSKFDAVLFSTFTRDVAQRFDITALSSSKGELVKIRYTDLNSKDIKADFKSAMTISESILENLLIN